MTAIPRPDLDTLLLHADWLHRLSHQLCRDEHAAADAAQDTWLQALRHRPDARGSTRGFLGAVLQNILRMRTRAQVRRTRRDRDVAHQGLAESAAEAAARAEMHQWLGEQVLALPEPQRALVLLHYDEGRAIADLARQQALTADAVRSHLRRARDTLRCRLRGSEGAPRRAFAALVAAHTATPSTLLGVTMAVSVHLKVAIGALILVAGFVAWRTVGASHDPLQVPAPDAPARAAASAAAGEAAPRRGEPAERSAVPALPLASPGVPMVRFELTGLLPDIPWTAPVHLELATGPNKVELAAAVAADGTFEVRVPAAAQVSIRGEDEWYLPLVHEASSVDLERCIALAVPCSIPVSPVAVCTGLVVDGADAAVAAARVAACAFEHGKAIGPAAQTNTRADGRFALQFSYAVELLVVAVAMQPRHDGAVGDNGIPRDDLLPAATRASVVLGRRTDVGHLVLPRPVYVTGSLTEPTGKPVAAEVVHWAPLRPSVGFAAGDLQLGGETWERLTLAVTAITDAEGAFRLPARAGVEGTLSFASSPRRFEPFVATRRVVAPAHVAMALAGNTAVLRVVRGDQPVRGVALGYHGYRGGLVPVSDDKGEIRLLREEAKPRQVTVRPPGVPFLTVELPVDARPEQPIVVDLARHRPAPVAFDVSSRFPVQQLHAVFRQHGRPVGAGVTVKRDAATGMLQGAFVPGSYRVSLHPGSDGSEHDGYVLETEIAIDVLEGGVQLPVELRHGGRVRIALRDAKGKGLAGSLRFSAPDGKERQVMLMSADGFGSFDGTVDGERVMTTDNLEEGTWEVVADVGAQGMQRRKVVVQACQVVDLVIQVP